MSVCQVIKLSGGYVVKFLGCQDVRYCKVDKWSGGQDIRMSGDQNVRVSDSNMIMWLGYQVARMSDCQVVATSGNLGRGSYMVGSSRNCIKDFKI